MRPPLPPRGPVSRHPRVSSSPLGWGQLPFGDVTGPPLGFESGGPSACSARDQAPPTCGPGPGTWLRSWGARSKGVVEAPGFPVGTGVTALPLAWGSLGLRPQERSPPPPPPPVVRSPLPSALALEASAVKVGVPPFWAWFPLRHTWVVGNLDGFGGTSPGCGLAASGPRFRPWPLCPPAGCSWPSMCIHTLGVFCPHQGAAFPRCCLCLE